jgi:hypothetical protein
MTISFQRTVYIPDNGDINKLSPSPGTFPLYHVKDYRGPARDSDGEGGLLLPGSTSSPTSPSR